MFKRTAIVVAGAAVLALVMFGFSSRADQPTAEAQATYLAIDAIPGNGTRPCDPIDATATVLSGASHQVAVCVVGNTGNPDSFAAEVAYDDTKNEGVDIVDTTPYLDDNPDANDGTGTDKLGTGWSCDPVPGVTTPPNMGPPAYILCSTITGTTELTAEPGLLATLYFDVVAVGVDTLTLTGKSEIFADNCLPTGTMDCQGAVITKAPAADLMVDKVAVPVPGPNFVLGGQIDYQITVTNQGTHQAPNVTVLDSLPEDKVYNDDATDALNGNPDICDWSDDFGVVVCYGDNVSMMGHEVLVLDPAQSETVHVVVDIPLDASKDVEVNSVLAMDFALSPVPTPGVADPDWTPILLAQLATIGLPNPDPPPDIIDFATAFENAWLMCAAERWGDPVSMIPPGTDLNGDGLICDNVGIAMSQVTPASLSISKVADAAVYSVGGTIHYTVTVSNADDVSPALDVMIYDVVDANQEITGLTCPAGFTGTINLPPLSAHCDADVGTQIDAGASVVMLVDADVVDSEGNTCTDTAECEWADPLECDPPAELDVTCLPPTVRMEKDIDEDATSIVDAVNLFLEKDGAGGLVPLVIYELVSNPGNDPDGVGAYEFQLKFDHKIFDIVIEDTSWLSNDGARTVDCSNTIITENWILFGCNSFGPTPGQTDPGTAATITVYPEPDLVLRLTPGQLNGVFRVLLDENCELADVLGDPLTLDGVNLAPGVLPGGLIAVCSDMAITVRILEADLNLDCIVDIDDMQDIAFRYGAVFGNIYYDPWYDLEPWIKDFDIDIKDLQKVFGRFGSTCDNPIPDQDPLPMPDP